MNKKNLTRVAGLSAAAMLALSGMAMAETTESALVKGGALNLRQTASLEETPVSLQGIFPQAKHHHRTYHKTHGDGKKRYSYIQSFFPFIHVVLPPS